MPRLTKRSPERGRARTRLLEAARSIIRQRGFNATNVDDSCKAAGVTKGAYFDHFESKEALSTAAAEFWTETTGALFDKAPYHAHADPLERLRAYIAFRKSPISGDLADFTCLVGTMTQETYASHPAIREACAGNILDHAATL